MKQGIRLLIILTILILSGCNSPFITIDLCIETIPPGATISCDNEFLGKTPKTVKITTDNAVSIYLAGYKEMIIKPDELTHPRTFRFIELKKYHELVLDYKPKGAEVWMGEDLLGITPFKTHMTKRAMELVVKFPHHNNYTDKFIIHGETMRTEELTPNKKYFPETICSISTTPAGASVKSLVVCDEKLLGEFDDWGITPVSGPNSEIMESKCDRLFILEKEGANPALLRFRGSINTNIKLTKSEHRNIPDIPSASPSELTFRQGEIIEGSQPFSAVFEGNSFKIYSLKYSIPVSIVDLETKGSKFSGASWWGERFFVIRFAQEDDIKYILYDVQKRKRVKFSDFGMHHEQNIPGIIRWNEQLPATNSRIENFYDIRFKEYGDIIFFYLKPFMGRECWLVLACSKDLSSSQLVDIIFK